MRLEYPKHSNWVFLFSLVPEVTAILFSAYLVFITISDQYLPIFPAAILFILIVAIAEYSLTFKPVVDFRDRQLSTFFKQYLNMAEDTIRNVTPDNTPVRASVMLLKKRRRWKFGAHNKYLSIDYQSEKSSYNETELEVEYEIGQGCPGRAIEKNAPQVQVSPDHEKSWDSGWGLTDHQDEVTEHLNIMIGAPIYRPSDEEKTNPIGVFVIDSEADIRELIDLDDSQSLQDVDFIETKLAQEAIRHGRNIGILL